MILGVHIIVFLQDSISEEIDFAACKVNLLDHIEQLQEELDHRLDELDQQLECKLCCKLLMCLELPSSFAIF